MNRRFIAPMMVMTLALLWRAALLFSIQDTPLAHLHEWDQSDMATFVEQARRIAGGDLLARDPYYPRHRWMRTIDAGQWTSWHRPGAFYQPPLYSYGLAVAMRTTGDPATTARIVQGLLGTIFCGAMVVLVRRLLGSRTGVAAGLICAIYGPLMAVESQLLRDGSVLMWSIAALGLSVLGLAAMRSGQRTDGWGAGLGLLAGAGSMLHEAALIFGALAMVYGVWTASRQGSYRIRAAARWIGWLGLGAVIGYAPMLIRNAMVGAPLAPGYFGSLIAFATANWPGAPGEALSERLLAPGLAEAMARANGRPLALLAETARAWEGSGGLAAWAAQWAERLGGLVIGPDANENLCHAYFRWRVPILTLALDFRVLGPLAAAGLVLGCRRWWRGLARGDGFGLVILYGLMMLGLISAVHPFGRYRLILMPVLAPLAGWTLARIWQCWRQRRWKRLGIVAAVIGVMALLQGMLGMVPSLRGLGELRQTEFLVNSRKLIEWGRPDLAAAELEDGLEWLPGNRQIGLELAIARGMSLQARGAWADAADEYRKALAIQPDHPVARLGLTTASEGRPLAQPERPWP